MGAKTAIVLGKGRLALQVASWFKESPEFELLLVVPNQPESSWEPSLAVWAVQHGVEAVAAGRVEDIAGVSEEGWRVDVAVSVTYNRILKSWFLERLGHALNIHNGLLPQYRGVNPINWALKNGDLEHGVTIHEMTPGIDEGPIWGEAPFAIDPATDEVIDVYERCLDHGWELFQDVMQKLKTGTPKPQDPGLARYYSKRDFDSLGERRFFTRAQSV